YLHSEFNESAAKLSPDGRWLAYQSDETKRAEVYVQGFPSPTRKWKVSSDGGALPAWSRDGKEFFFISADGNLMAAAIKPGSEFEAGVPQPLFAVQMGGAVPSFDVGSDGRFLIPTIPPRGPTPPITVLVNWQSESRK